MKQIILAAFILFSFSVKAQLATDPDWLNPVVSVCNPDTTAFLKPLIIKDGTEGDNKILTSDAFGRTHWQTPSGGFNCDSAKKCVRQPYQQIVYGGSVSDTSDGGFYRNPVTGETYIQAYDGAHSSTFGIGVGSISLTNTNMTGEQTWLWPQTDGTAGQALITDHAGGTSQLGWAGPFISANQQNWTDSAGTLFNTILGQNVGIGTTTPGVKLDVVGTVNMHSESGNVNTNIALNPGFFQQISQNSSTTGLTQITSVVESGGNVLLGTATFDGITGQTSVTQTTTTSDHIPKIQILSYDVSSARSIEVNNGAITFDGVDPVPANNSYSFPFGRPAAGYVLGDDGTASGVLAWCSAASADSLFLSSGNGSLWVTNTDLNFGIGTSTPEHKLHVFFQGDESVRFEYITDAFHGGLFLDTNNFNVSLTPESSIVWRSSNYSLLENPNGIEMNSGGGNVGIGTASPAYKLEIDGDFHASQTIGNHSYDVEFDAGSVSIGVANSDSFANPFIVFNSDGLNRISTASNNLSINGQAGDIGFVGIGTASPTAKLHVIGSALFDITGTTLHYTGLQTFVNNAAAIVGGLVAGDVYVSDVAGDLLLKVVQ